MEPIAVTIGWAQPGRAPLAALALCTLLASLGMSGATIALPALALAFNASFHQVQWVVIAYLLSITSLIVGVGRLGDIAGRRRLLAGGVALFAAASLLAALAPTLWLLIAARAGQGLGAAFMMALGMAFVGETVPKAQIGSAMGLLGTMSAVGTALGPSLGGVLVDGFGWRAIFLLNVPLGMITLYLALRHLPPDRPRTGSPAFDFPGTLLLALTLAAYALAMTLGGGSAGPLNAALLLGAALAAIMFVLAESGAAAPMVDLAMFRDRALSASLAMSALVSAVMMATLVVGPFYLARAFGLDAAAVGLVLGAGPVAAGLAGLPAGRLADRYGAQRMALAGVAGIAAGALALALVPAATGVPGYLACIAVMTVHFSLFQAANNTAVMADVHPGKRGVVSGMLNLSRNLGFMTGASVMGSLFAMGAGSTEPMTATPAQAAAGLRITFMAAAGLVGIAFVIGAAVRRR